MQMTVAKVINEIRNTRDDVLMNPVIDALLKRRSVVANEMHEPGPNPEQLDTILRAAHRVPDHGKLGPWRFVIFQGEARHDFSQKLHDIFQADHPEATDKLKDFEASRFTRAPLVIAVISSPIVDHPKVPVWEQELTVGAVCMNINHAAHALGFVAQWLTEWYAFHDDVDKLLNLSESERIAGYMYIGSHTNQPKERVRPEVESRVSYWQG